MRERICLGGCSDVTEDDLKEFKVLEFIEVEPDKLVWNDAGTGTWTSGPPVGPFDSKFSDPWSERFKRNVARETAWYCLVFFDHTFLMNIGPKSRTGPFIYIVGSAHPWYRSRSRGLILDPNRPNTK